ncbi:caspase-3 [Hydra vulgaris]|uniref:caspase-3 n=1 Tax=Hydra vulgaris TaxID=6087 RepID=UPI0002B43473|nr:caspase-3 [Hydra vulgaris]
MSECKSYDIVDTPLLDTIPFDVVDTPFSKNSDIVFFDSIDTHPIDILNAVPNDIVYKFVENSRSPCKITNDSESPNSEFVDGGVNQQDVDGFFSKSTTVTSSYSYTHTTMEEERKDNEGIVFKHTSFSPKLVTKEQNTKVSYDSDFYYDMSTFPRGKMTILNVKYFRRASGMADYPRHGTDRDADNLCELFVELGFVVDRYDNPTRNDILSILKAAANEDYSKMSCCAVAILTHGEEGILYGTDAHVKIKDITKLFRTRSLAGKPKLFLFQACQGSEYMNPIDSVDGPGNLANQKDAALTLPSESDFLYAYSTVPGYYSWRNSTNGSWFMESLCGVFRQYAHKMDVLRMLTRANEVLSKRKSNTAVRATDNKTQIASIVTQLRKDFFMNPPNGPLETKPHLPGIKL